MPTLGLPELVVLLVIVLAVFGAGKLPQVGRAAGQSIREFRNAVSDGGEDENNHHPTMQST